MIENGVRFCRGLVLEVNYDEDGEIEDTDVVDRKNVIEFWIED